MRVGIIGTNWGRMHIGAFRGAGADVVALCGRDLARTQELARTEGVALGTNDLQQLFAASQVVVVASPDGEHHAHVLAALRAGCHVLCEKPLAATAAEAGELARVAAQHPSQVCAVGFPYRQLPPFAALRDWAQTWPRPSSLTVTVRSAFVQRPEPTADLNGMSHLLDAAFWLMDEQPIWVEATSEQLPSRVVSIAAGLASGRQVTVKQAASDEPGIHGVWVLFAETRVARVTGGYVPALGGWRLGPAQVSFPASDHWTTLSPQLVPIEGTREPWAQAHVENARELLAVISGAPRRNLASFEDGARVQRVLGAAVDSAAAAGRRVQL